MLITYPALFYYDDTDDVAAVYSIFFPDFIECGATQGESIEDAMFMASDFLGIAVADFIESNEELPKPSNINNLSLEKNDPFKDHEDINMDYDKEKSFISMVSVDLKDYLNQDIPVKKTLTIPKWADKLGKEMQVNFSQLLTEAIADLKLQKKS